MRSGSFRSESRSEVAWEGGNPLPSTRKVRGLLLACSECASAFPYSGHGQPSKTCSIGCREGRSRRLGATYYQQHRAEYIARAAAWQRAHPDDRRRNAANWKKAHPDKVSAEARRRSKRIWLDPLRKPTAECPVCGALFSWLPAAVRAAGSRCDRDAYCSPECARRASTARNRRYRHTHPQKARWWSKEYRHRRKAGEGALTERQVRWRFDLWGWRCWICGISLDEESVTIDHVKPLSRGGRHVASNIRPACLSCNSRKHNRWPLPAALTAKGQPCS